MKKKLWVLIVLLLFLFCSYFLFALYKSNERNSLLLKAIKDKPNSEEINMLKTNRKIAIENVGKQLGNLCSIDFSRDTVLLKSLFLGKEKKLFVCRFSKHNCYSCVNYSIKILLKSVDFIGKDNILFLGSYNNNRIFQREVKGLGIDDSFMSLNTGDNVEILVDKLNFPYFFILDSNLNVLSISIPNKGTPKLDRSYIKLIGERYFLSD